MHIKPEVMVLMAVAGGLAEERLCGPKGVFIGALDDVRQLKEAAEGQNLDDVRALVQQATDEVVKREAQVLLIADILDETGSFAWDGVSGAAPEAASRPARSYEFVFRTLAKQGQPNAVNRLAQQIDQCVRHSATSIAAEELSPAPSGTSPQMKRLAPCER